MSSLKLIICLFVVLSLLPICISAISVVSKFDYDYSFTSSQICLMQLRESLLLAYDLKVMEKELTFRYKGNQCSLSLLNNKLILKPGTQIFIDDVDDIRFYVKDNAVMMYFKRKNREYETAICQAKGIYLSDFYCNLDDDSDTDNPDDQLHQ